MQRFLLLFLVSFYAMVNTNAQEDSLPLKFDTTPIEVQNISAEDIAEFRNDPKFDYEITESSRTWWDDFKTWVGNLFLRFFEWIFGIEEAVGALAVFLKILPYLLLVLLLLLLIRFFLNVNSSTLANANSIKPQVALSEEEHIIKNEDIQVLIQKALHVKNYRLALRYYYLFILQLMSEKEHIDWQLQKTNHDYENEIKETGIKKEFTKITRLYDYVWYGDFSIDATQYQKAEKVFLTMEKALKNA